MERLSCGTLVEFVDFTYCLNRWVYPHELAVVMSVSPLKVRLLTNELPLAICSPREIKVVKDDVREAHLQVKKLWQILDYAGYIFQNLIDTHRAEVNGILQEDI